MTDNFERAQQRILKEAKKNGGVTTDHILDALIATNEDLDAQHKETAEWHKDVTKLVNEHIKEATVRDGRLDKLEADRLTCEEKIRAYVQREHEERHTNYVKELQASRSRIVTFFATGLGRAALVLFGLVAGIVLNILVYGRP